VCCSLSDLNYAQKEAIEEWVMKYKIFKQVRGGGSLMAPES
jgi:hypothetical protein